MPAGFIGVDIFFVISGYLVSTVIVDSLQAQRFKFTDFFARRLWRLQPAIIVLLLVCSLIASMFYLPEDFIEFLKSAKYTSLLTSNQYFERTTTGYAGPDTAQLLLLHTWSLSIEWQWYLVLPLALWGLYRYCPSRARAPVVFISAVGAITLSLALSKYYPEKSYYYFLARVFEFLAGVSAASFTTQALSLSLRTRSALSIASLCTLFYVATQPGLLLGFPDYHAVIVCVAAAWLLMAGADKDFWYTKLLSWQPLVYIGTISYSLYLWHWPVFATTHYLGLDTGVIATVACLGLTFALSYLSYTWVERRFRRYKVSPARTLLMLWVVPGVLFTLLYSMASKNEGYPARFGKEMTSIISTLRMSEAPSRESCLGGRTDAQDPNCTIGAERAASASLLVGDSFSNQYWGFFDVLGKDANVSFLVRGTSSCLVLPNIYLFDWWTFKDTVYAKCHDNTEKYLDLIKSNHYRYVVLGQAWGNYEGDHVISQPGDLRSTELSHTRVESAFEDMLQTIIASGAQPVVIKAPAPMPDRFSACFFQHFKLRQQPGEGDCQIVSSVSQQGWFDLLFKRMQVKHPQLIVIDPKDVQCDATSCLTALEGIPVYRDVGHITDFASYAFGRRYLERFTNPLR